MFDEQTFWNDFINDKTLPTFKTWVGGPESPSKVYLYNWLKDKNYESILDVGCGDKTLKKGIDSRKIEIEYTGVDSCNYFSDNDVITCDFRKMPLDDRSIDLVFGRHILEHQPYFENSLKEMIRVAKKEIIHIFFIKPTLLEKKKKYEPSTDNLYHNNYNKSLIEDFLTSNSKVKGFRWKNLNNQENVIHIEVE